MRSRMARYTMLNSMRQGGGNSRGEMRGEGGNMRGEMRNEGRNEMRGGYGQSEMRGGMEMGYGGYSEMGYEAENRFRDRRGREHYDNGRFAPMRGEMENEMEMRRGNQGGGNRGGGNRGGNQGGARNEYRMENYGGMEYRGGEMRGGREGEMRRGGGRSEMRGGWDEEEEMRMNQIGFERPQEMESHYPTRIDYAPRNEMERGSSPRMGGGAKGAEMEFTPEIAKEWTKKMHNEDGTRGEHWSMEQVKKLMTQRGIEYNPAEVYAIMNALYSDYCKVLKKYGFNSSEGYLDLALAWLNDQDAIPNKAMMYYEFIVK